MMQEENSRIDALPLVEPVMKPVSNEVLTQFAPEPDADDDDGLFIPLSLPAPVVEMVQMTLF
jgi:hypothetical protein